MTLFDALSNVPESNLSKRHLYCSVEVETFPVDKFIQSFTAEEELDAAEDRFDRIKLWRIGDVENRLDVEAFHFFHRFIACVH